MKLANLSDDELVKLAQRADEGAFAELIARHDGRAYIIALDMLRDNRHDAHEALQESRLRAWGGLQRIRGGDFEAWYLGIVRNCCTDLYKRQQTTIGWAITEDVEIASPLEQLLSRENRSILLGAVMCLPSQQATAVRMSYLEQRSYREIAETLGVSESTARTHVNEGLKTLRERLPESILDA